MEYLTAEQIAGLADEKDGIANIRAINRLYRDQDDSHKWPINGKFNATERAIRRVRTLTRHNGAIAGMEYAYAIDWEISQIVNDERNW